MSTKTERKLIYINGYEWWIDESVYPQMVYGTKEADSGFSVHSQYLTDNERKQLADYIKYGKNNITQ